MNHFAFSQQPDRKIKFSKLLITPFFIILFVFLIGCSENETVRHELNKFLKDSVPDRREVVFNVKTQTKGNRLTLSGETDSEELKSKLINLFNGFTIDNQIITLPDSTVGNKQFGLITISVANLRAEPDHSSELVTQALMGMPVKILKKQDDWWLIQTPDKYISWVDNDALAPISEEEFNQWKNSERIIFTAETGFVKRTIENKSDVVSDVAMGNILQVLEKGKDFIQVKLPDGRTGFIENAGYTDFRTFSEQPCLVQKIILLAKTFTGRPYLWGGTSSRAMDCSGFVKMVYYMNGIILARDASLQARFGEEVSVDPKFENIHPGDLLFFGTNKPKITHVALSTGKSEYIHASGMIKENSFDPDADNYSEYRENTFICCKRILGSEGDNGLSGLVNIRGIFSIMRIRSKTSKSADIQKYGKIF